MKTEWPRFTSRSGSRLGRGLDDIRVLGQNFHHCFPAHLPAQKAGGLHKTFGEQGEPLL
jgi:hypothetical protein